MLLNGFLFTIGVVLAILALGVFGFVFDLLFEYIVGKQEWKEFNKYNWKNRKKKNEHID